MVLLDADKFLTELTRLYEKHKGKGTVWVTMKRASMKAPAKKEKGEKAAAAKTDADSGEYKCLVRATDGKKKISTALGPNQVVKFHSAYTILQKAHMDSLKSKKKEKKKPAKGGAGAKAAEGKGHTARA